MKETFIKLLKVKSLMTICVMGVFTYLAITEKLDTAVTTSVISAVITYYFTRTRDNE